MHDGLVVVDKPAGWTSHDVVGKLRRIYGQKRVGHAGTLDPAATGVLLVGLGRVTRLLRFLQETGKEYRGLVKFGVATDTLDGEGTEVARAEMSFTREQLDAAAASFRGNIMQVPPMVSALKVDGKKLYELAREGKEVERKPRPVRIDTLEVESYEPGPFPSATIRVECSSGTYIRTLAADLGDALGSYAHLGGLRRLRVGSFTLAEAHPMDAIEADPDAACVSPLVAMRDLEVVGVESEQAAAILHGATFSAGAFLPADAGEGPFAVVDPAPTLLAVYERRGEGVKPAVVVA